MLFRHFVEEVRQRDRDGDGRLSRREYGGEADDFHAVDLDGDGLVSAEDLTRAALQRSDDLREIVEGHWTPIYESVMRVQEPTTENLIEAVHHGASKIADAVGHELGAGAPPDDDETASTAASIARAFLARNSSLTNLHQRLQRLLTHLGHSRRYHSIDLLG
jgi:hypothetical protein